MRLPLSILFLLICLARGAQAEEGLWTFDHFPRTVVQEKYGFAVTDMWLQKIQRSVTRHEDGCSGTIISSQGLVITNEHCVQMCLADLSDPTHDYIANGFLATTLSEERKCPGELLSILVGVEDITAKVTAATRGLNASQAGVARRAILTRLESECARASERNRKTGPLGCESVSLYQGGQYFLYKYKRYTDVRMVFAPHVSIASFGGDPDNFNYPRWNLEMSMLRVYENGNPAVTPDFIRWRIEGPQAGELVFVAGHPGSTDRLHTVAQFAFMRDTFVPSYIVRTSELRGRLLQWSKTSDEAYRLTQEPLLSTQNTLKVFRGWQAALLDDALFTQHKAAEDALRAAVMRDSQLASDVGGAWAQIERAEQRCRQIFDRHVYLEAGVGFQSSLFGYARFLVRATSERAKPNESRLREYTDSNLAKMRGRLLDAAPIYPELEKLTLSFSLDKLREALGPDDPLVRRLMSTDSPDTLAARLIDNSKLADPELRNRLWQGGSAAVEASDDPMITLARQIDPEAREVRRIYDDEVLATITDAQERIARARFKILGTSAYPDATSTLRLTYGTVAGWNEKGVDVEPFTHLDRLYERATGKDPFALPQLWLDARKHLDPRTPFNFTSTNDIIGGNSGSPVIGRDGTLVGLIFDSNIHGIAGEFWYDANQNRAVSVHPQIMMLALRDVYHADNLVAEITSGKIAANARK